MFDDREKENAQRRKRYHARVKAHRPVNREVLNARQKKYYQDNREVILAKQREQRTVEREQRATQKAVDQGANAEKIAALREVHRHKRIKAREYQARLRARVKADVTGDEVTFF